ncbi:MAG: GNAT family N-acetyltransferase [Caulobacteraceae bacterium]
MLIGRKIRLRAKEKKDLEALSDIFNDPKFSEFDMSFLAAFSKERMEKDFEKEIKENIKDTGSEHFVIVNEDGRVIGDIVYHKSNETQNIYMIGIGIGSSYWSCGYGQDAITTLLRYLFLERNAHKVELMVRDTNPRAVRCYEKCGFAREALLREGEFSGGKAVNYHYMGILKEEYLERGDS